MAVKGKEHFWGVCKAVLGCKTWKMVSVSAPHGISAGKCSDRDIETHLSFSLLPEILGK